ncbi:zinc-binding dehydrogenase [Curtobacterium citreum]|uniref:zinc-binding dehydrogenase n=1 Tax=Curtobacterium citreum TaxID=2036 RepID=UPI00254C7A90|nr:zinc-binding dehydrogenase [Curtobacterium citreum]MDK8172278.1 zinc-binding dehydrogenase [Curtobacterium citreum]
MNESTTTRPAENIAVVIHAANDLRVERRPFPVPQSDEVLLRVVFGGICGSDLHYWKHGAAGDSILREPMILGHEIVGLVERPAADGSGPPLGTPVAVHPATTGTAPGRYPSDRPNLAPGTTYLGSAARLPHTPGGFARFTAMPTRMLRPLPDGLSMRSAAVAEPAAVALHAVHQAGDIRGKRVLVVGAGPIGALAVAVARRAGARQVIATDLQEHALKLATTIGADRALSARDSEGVASVDADIVIESSGSSAGLAAAIEAATRGGTVVMVGLLPSGLQPALIALATTKELRLIGSFRFVDEITEVLQALADGTLSIDAVATHEFAAEDALAAFDVAADPSRSSKVLLRF